MTVEKTVKKNRNLIATTVIFFLPSTLKKPFLEDNKSPKTNRHLEWSNECFFLCRQHGIFCFLVYTSAHLH